MGEIPKIAFANARHRLQSILESLEIMSENRSIDDLMTAEEKQFGVASLVRCSFGKMGAFKQTTPKSHRIYFNAIAGVALNRFRTS